MLNPADSIDDDPENQNESEANLGLRALLDELDTDQPLVALSRVRQLKAGQRVNTPVTPAAANETSGSPGLRAVAAKVAALNGTISSMEEQLASLYGDRERLEREIGASEVDDVIAVFQNLKAIIASMEEQLSCMYQDREILDGELGRSDPQEIVSMFRNVTRLLNGARQELQTA